MRQFRRMYRRGNARRVRVAAVLGFTLSPAACDTGSQERVSTTMRDSAGVQIAEIQGDPWRAPACARLDTAKVFRIEPDDARPATLFGRVQDVLRLSDGRIVVLDGGRYQALVFAPDGLPVRTIGRRGQGPGELRFPVRLLRIGSDSIGIVDGDHVEIFAVSGGDSRRVRMPAADRDQSTQAFAAVRTGGYVTRSGATFGESRVGRNSTYATMGVARADGTPVRALGRHLASEYTYRAGGSDGPLEVATLFWQDPEGAALPAGYVWCLSTRFDCQVWSAAQGYVRSIRSTVLPRAVTSADIDALTADWLRGLRTHADSADNRAVIAVAERMPRMPVFSAVRTDTRGRIWMRAYLSRDSEQTVRWLVIESTGRVLGTVTTPSRLRVYDIGDDYVLGVDRDADDVERIVMYPYAVAR